MKIKLKIFWIIIFINLKISELAKSNSKNFQLHFFLKFQFLTLVLQARETFRLKLAAVTKQHNSLKIISQRDLRHKLKYVPYFLALDFPAYVKISLKNILSQNFSF